MKLYEKTSSFLYFFVFPTKNEKMAHILLILLIQVLKIMNNFEHESN